MPIATRNGYAIVRLHQDAGVDLAKRPGFYARYILEDELQQIEDLYLEATASKDMRRREQSAILTKALAIILIGWENVTDRAGNPVPFALEHLGQVLTSNEKHDLLLQLLKGVQLAEDEIKKSAAQSVSDTGPTAQAVPKADA